MNIDLSATILRFARPKSVRRPGSTTYVNGFPTFGPEETRIVDLVVRPATAKQMVRLSEGDRAQGAVKWWGPEALAVVTVDSSQPGDIIEHDGDLWEVREVNPSTDQGKYWSGLAVRRGR